MAWRDAFQPLRVTARLRTGVVTDCFFPLDGILLYQACRMQLGDQDATLPGGATHADSVSMPLQVIRPGQPDWYYACSWAQPRPWWLAEGRDYWNKRFDANLSDLVDFGKRRGRVIVEQARYKAYHMPIFYRVADRVCWYCVGDQALIAALLSTLTHVGKKAAQGWGRVIEWTVTPIAEDWSTWRDGRLTRGVPESDALALIRRHGSFEPFDVINYAVRPPGYRRENQMRLAVPR